MRRLLAILLLSAATALAAPALTAPSVNPGYGRVSPTNTLEYAPSRLDLGNIVHGRAFPDPIVALNPSAEDYASQGWLPVSTNIPPCEEEGFENVGIGRWYVTNSVADGVTNRIIAQRYITVPLPPAVHTYKKSYLAQWLYANGYWDAFKALLAQSADAAFFWETSTEFDSDHPQWPAIYGGIKAALQIPDEAAEEWLWYGEYGPQGQGGRQ